MVHTANIADLFINSTNAEIGNEHEASEEDGADDSNVGSQISPLIQIGGDTLPPVTNFKDDTDITPLVQVYSQA